MFQCDLHFAIIDRKKKGFDVEEWFRLERNRGRKESQLRARQVTIVASSII